MPYQITSSLCGDIKLANETIETLNAFKLPGSIPLSAQDTFGEMTLQKTHCDQCSVLYSFYRIRENVTFYSALERPLLRSPFCIEKQNAMRHAGCWRYAFAPRTV